MFRVEAAWNSEPKQDECLSISLKPKSNLEICHSNEEKTSRLLAPEGVNPESGFLPIWGIVYIPNALPTETMLQQVFQLSPISWALLHYLCRRIGRGPERSFEPLPLDTGTPSQYGHYA